MKMLRHLSVIVLFFSSLVLWNSVASAYQYIYSCGPVWTNLPVTYQINENGSADFSSFSTLETILQNSFSPWADPCCSSFDAQYTGTTTRTALNAQTPIVLSFEENNWPSQMGDVNQTIAVTLSSVYNNCTIASAPILFNGVGFRFSSNGNHTDLQSVATHEVGHLLGLGHSQVRQATMYFSYTGGTNARVLHQDDIDGVCSLYTRACSCSSDGECPDGEGCVNGQCEQIPCTNNSQCSDGLECIGGDCIVPPCTYNSDCADGFTCENQKCVSECPVCRPCESTADCGGAGYCAQLPEGNKCVVMCGEDGMCPGDSECYRVNTGQQTYHMCLAPTADDEFCPSDYICREKEPVQGCPGLGTVCNDDASSCDAANDMCLVFNNGDDICSCSCASDADCGEGNHCGDLNGGYKGCFVGPREPPTEPEQPDNLCGGVVCTSNQTCVNNQCQDNNNSSSPPDTNNNQGGSPTPGGENPGTNEDDIIVLLDEPESSTCSSSGSSSPVNHPLALVVAFASFLGYRRRKSSNSQH